MDQVVILYEQGNFKDAELLALRTLQSPEKLPPVDRAILYKTLGFTYVALGEKEKAKKQFLSWIELDSLAELDPLYVSPKIIAIFGEAKAEFRQHQTQPVTPNYGQIELQIAAVKRSLLFPGLGQLYRGQQYKGFSLLFSEIACLSAFLYYQDQYRVTRDRYLLEVNSAKMNSLYDDVNLYYHLKYTSALLAGGIYLYSLYDVLFWPPREDKKNPPISLHFSPLPSSFITLSLKL